MTLTVPCFGWVVHHLAVLAASGKLSEARLGPVDAIVWFYAFQTAIKAGRDVAVRLVIDDAISSGCAVFSACKQCPANLVGHRACASHRHDVRAQICCYLQDYLTDETCNEWKAFKKAGKHGK